MFGNKKGIVYQLDGTERGHLEMISMLRAILDAQASSILQKVIRREGIEANAEVSYDPTQFAFIRTPTPKK